ncbi:hypothetical protein F4808DRAFT_404776 [Astrocystis sublimbata]|nr:hypothetical protein F4808DRAFT_404776 [Astrocystis sublimbata]
MDGSAVVLLWFLPRPIVTHPRHPRHLDPAAGPSLGEAKLGKWHQPEQHRSQLKIKYVLCTRRRARGRLRS